MSDEKQIDLLRRLVVVAMRHSDPDIAARAVAIWNKAMAEATAEFRRLHPELDDATIDTMVRLFEIELQKQ